MPLSASIFRRGGPKKELFDAIGDKGEEAEVDDEAELQDKLKELDELLHTSKSGKDLSAAVWRPGLCAAEMVMSRKGCARDIGFSMGRRQYLHIEEAVYLVDRGDLMLFAELAGGRQRLLSMQEALDLMVCCGVPMERYLVYSMLLRGGYMLMRHPSRWQLEGEDEGQAPADVWGQGAWARCYGRTAGVPGAAPLPPTQQALMARQAQQQGGGAAGGGGGGAEPMDCSAGGHSAGEECDAAGSSPQQHQEAVTRPPLAAAPPAARGACSMLVDGEEACATATGPARQPQPQPEHPHQQEAAAGPRAASSPPCAAAASGGPLHHAAPPAWAVLKHAGGGAGAGGGGGGGPAGWRGWWQASGPHHPLLQGVGQDFFDAMQPALVEARQGDALRAQLPRMRPFGAIAPPPQPHAAIADAPAQPSSAAPCDVGLPSGAAQLVFDVYRPGAYVSRSRRQYPWAMAHLVLCSEGPPGIADLQAADKQAAEAALGAGGTAAPVMWAAVLNGDVAMYSIGRADLMQLM